MAEGRVKDGRPRERFTGTLEGGDERSKDLSSVAEKCIVKVNHIEKALNSRFFRGQRKIFDG